MNRMTTKDYIVALLMSFILAMTSLSPVYLAILIEATWPLMGISLLVGFECSTLILLELTAVMIGIDIKADLERLRTVYDAESEPWDDIYPIAPIKRIRLACLVFQSLPLIYSGISTAIQGFRWPFVIASVIIFGAVYRVVPKLVVKLARTGMVSDYVKDKLKYYGERGAQD